MAGTDDTPRPDDAEPAPAAQGAAWSDLTGDARGEAYDARWARLSEVGQSVHGEVDLIDDLVGRRPPGAPNAVILDAGCGTGRVAVELVRRGHRIIGVDRDPDLLAAARRKMPQRKWHERDLRDVGSVVAPASVDVVVMAGNVLLFADEGTEAAIVEALATTLRPGGLMVAGFQLRRGGLTAAAYDAMCGSVGLTLQDRWSTWDRQPWSAADEYQVSVHRQGIAIDLGPR